MWSKVWWSVGVAWLCLLLGGCAPKAPPSSPPEPQPAIDALAWLSGTWLSETDGGSTEESWSEPRGGMLLGVNRTVKAGRTVHFEHLRIEGRKAGVVYVAAPSNQPPAEFAMVAGSPPGTAVFENMSRGEFPLRLTYRREGDTLHARAEGPGAEVAEWTWKRRGDVNRPVPAPPMPVAAKEHESFFEDDLVFDDEWVRGDAAALGLDEAVLDEIVKEAARTRSDSLLIVKDGRIAVERYFGHPSGPIETMSMTKSIVSILIGMLIADGKIPSVDAPLSTWFPDWSSGLKAKVTLRHVLTHTSGLEHGQGSRVLNEQEDRLDFVRRSPITEPPGSRFSYSNEAVQLLSGVIAAASGRGADEYAADRLFAPLGIGAFSWDKDGAGNAQTFYGVALSARDLARIGKLMLDRGVWHKQQLVPAAWVDESTTAAANTPDHGLLWWIRNARGHVSLSAAGLDLLTQRGFTGSSALAALVDQPYSTHAALWMDVGPRLGESERSQLGKLLLGGVVPFQEKAGEPLGFAADGWLGQQLIVLPKHRVIAVRQHRAPENSSLDDAYNQKVGFFDLVKRLERALPPLGVTGADAQAPRP